MKTFEISENGNTLYRATFYHLSPDMVEYVMTQPKGPSKSGIIKLDEDAPLLDIVGAILKYGPEFEGWGGRSGTWRCCGGVDLALDEPCICGDRYDK